MANPKQVGLKPADWPLVMAAAEKLFPPDNPYGVFSFGIGPKVVKGIPQSTFTLVVRVERKWREPARPVPEIVFQGEEGEVVVRPDVIATGRRPRASSGGPLRFTGLHPGAFIVIGTGNARPRGGVACLLATESDSELPTHLLTAGHLFRPDTIGAKVFAGLPGSVHEILIGNLQLNLLDDLSVSPYAIDAALVHLTEEGIDMAQQSVGQGPSLEGVRELALGEELTAQVFRPTTNDYSPPVTISRFPDLTRFDSPYRPNIIEVVDSIRASSDITIRGDSGTVLFTTEGSCSAVGSCIGVDGSSCFEPLARSLPMIRESAQETNLSLWRPRNEA